MIRAGTGTSFTVEVRPRIPEALSALGELADDLLYSWDRRVRGLFYRLDPMLWERCGHNPKVFIRHVSQERLDEMARDKVYMDGYHSIVSAHRWYHETGMRPEAARFLNPESDLVAYFCAEYGFHESLPIYSGGLGILAGDHCKAASDLAIPFVALGLLYRQGYFTQIIDGQGRQVSRYTPIHIADMPIRPAVAADGSDLEVRIDLPGRQVVLRVWRIRAGHVTLYLLDSDHPENTEADRTITYQLYGGDAVNRIQQEMALGIGGVRALRALGLSPTVWHINEGHPALQILERCREWVDRGLDFDSALERVASKTVFTTHTPIEAGHDLFEPKLASAYFSDLAAPLKIDLPSLLALGANPRRGEGFNMTALALRGSRFHNGVSRQHGQTASEMESYMWPQIVPEENPIGHITNGVHVPTFLRGSWANFLDMHFGGEWLNQLGNEDYWQCIDRIPDHQFRSIRKTLKSKLLEEVRRRIVFQCQRNRYSQTHIQRLVRHLSPNETDVLILAFARRFTQYKRPTLIFSDPERLARLLNDPARPVLLIFAGKAHPQDGIGQDLIRAIHEFSRKPEFEGKVIFLENYDLALARWLVTGTDILLNTPEYPLEASGTSGQKAGINGVLNLSTLVGWWDEGCNGENGWAITPQDPAFDPDFRNREEARELYEILESQIVPLFFDPTGKGYSEGWIRKSKRSMQSLIPRFSAQRMVMDYVATYYEPANRQGRLMGGQDGLLARELARWKRKVSEAWSDVRLTRIDDAPEQIHAGETIPVRVAAELGGLEPGDVIVECLIGTENSVNALHVKERMTLKHEGYGPDGETLFHLDLTPPLSGLQSYRIRAYPSHRLLCHPFETGQMVWL